MASITDRRWWIGVTAGAVVGIAGIAVAEGMQGQADASPISVTPTQLLINQRISQAAVRRSNESLQLLDPVRKSGPSDTAPGWGTAQIADGAVTAAKLDSTVRDGQSRWAVVEATTGKLTRAKGASSYQATIGDGGTTPVTTGGQVSDWRSATDAKTVVVRTGDQAGAPTNSLSFQLSVTC
jgi:hypothetical protein